MDANLVVRKVIQKTLLFVWFKKEIITNEPSAELRFLPEIGVNLIERLNICVWVDSFVHDFSWKDFFSKHFERMTSSTYLFVNYIAYIFYILNESPNACERFFDTLSIVTYVGICCWQKERKKFINTCAELFCTFFERNIRIEFENQGGWKHFDEYLENHKNVKMHDTKISTHETPLDYFQPLLDRVGETNALHYTINGILVKDISREQVEMDERSINFAKSLRYTIDELYKKEFQEILRDFESTDCDVKYQQTFGEASDGIERKAKNLSVPKIQTETSQNNPSTFKPGKEQRQTVTSPNLLEIPNVGNIDSQDAGTSDKALHVFTSRQSETVRKLLKDIKVDLFKLSGVIQSLCRRYGVQNPEREESKSNVKKQ